MLGILRNEKHKGDALLQKTYTADFLTKKQVKNRGEISQVYIEDNHEGIIDKDTWEAVQEELKRRDAFMEQHGLKMYARGMEPNLFSFRTFCGECGKSYTSHSWKSRGIQQWQCKGHRTNGVLTCRNAFVDHEDLKKGFVAAYNKLMADSRRKAEWEKTAAKGSALERLRARQMIELSRQEPLTVMVDELAQLVITEILILGAKKYEFTLWMGANTKFPYNDKIATY